MSTKQGTKVLGLKAFGAGTEATDEQLAKINGYALVTLAADQVYVRKLLLAHNCIDRDNERFPDAMLDQFAVTIVGKSLLFGHSRKDTGSGLFFEASTEEMTAEQFKTLTGEEPRLPEGMDRCKVLWAWFYTIKTGSDDWLKWIDGGITRHCSIGFAAADLTAIRKDPNGPALYWEYVPPGEALEGSFVWLGAQPGATTQKAFDKNKEKNEGGKDMKILVVGVGSLLGKTLATDIAEEALLNEIKTLIAGKDAEILELKKLEDLAADGKAYRDDLIADAVKFAVLLGEVKDDEKAKKEEEEFLKTVPIARLKSQRDKYEAAARAKFPTHATFQGKDQKNREERQDEGKDKSAETSGKKDFTRPEHNELFKSVGK